MSTAIVAGRKHLALHDAFDAGGDRFVASISLISRGPWAPARGPSCEAGSALRARNTTLVPCLIFGRAGSNEKSAIVMSMTWASPFGVVVASPCSRLARRCLVASA